MKENSMWGKLRDRLRIGHKARCTRIENIVAIGTPDINCTVDGKMFWIETKYAPPGRDSSLLLGRSHKLTIEQINFHIAEHRAGGVSWIWVQCGTKHFLFPGCVVRLVNDLTIEAAKSWEFSMQNLVNKLLSD
jgi:hypothetical protein